MNRDGNGADFCSIKVCPICGKKFAVTSGQYLYKMQKNNKTIHYCSYTCWRKAGGGNGKK